MIEASSLHGFLLEFLTGLLLLQSSLDFLLDEEGLSISGCDKFGPIGLEFLFLVPMVLLLKLKLRSLHVD